MRTSVKHFTATSHPFFIPWHQGHPLTATSERFTATSNPKISEQGWLIRGEFRVNTLPRRCFAQPANQMRLTSDAKGTYGRLHGKSRHTCLEHAKTAMIHETFSSFKTTPISWRIPSRLSKRFVPYCIKQHSFQRVKQSAKRDLGWKAAATALRAHSESAQ